MSQIGMIHVDVATLPRFPKDTIAEVKKLIVDTMRESYAEKGKAKQSIYFLTDKHIEMVDIRGFISLGEQGKDILASFIAMRLTQEDAEPVEAYIMVVEAWCAKTDSRETAEKIMNAHRGSLEDYEDKKEVLMVAWEKHDRENEVEFYDIVRSGDSVALANEPMVISSAGTERSRFLHAFRDAAEEYGGALPRFINKIRPPCPDKPFYPKLN